MAEVSYLMYQSRTWPPGSPCIPLTLLVTGPSWMTHPASLPWTLKLRGLDCPSLYNPTILVTCPLWAFGPPRCYTWFPSVPPCPLSSHGTVQSGLSQVSPPGAVLSHISIINFLPHPTQKQSCSFPLDFFFLIHLLN